MPVDVAALEAEAGSSLELRSSGPIGASSSESPRKPVRRLGKIYIMKEIYVIIEPKICREPYQLHSERATQLKHGADVQIDAPPAMCK